MGAFATTAPVESEIVPVTVANAVWPKAAEAHRNRDIAIAEMRPMKFPQPKQNSGLVSGRDDSHNLCRTAQDLFYFKDY